ncbi:MAG TPA: MFS transporter [Candidatus Angelobacter sp.]|jgi:DHA2 family methylenomycin A resistance protein-like MFS transporter
MHNENSGKANNNSAGRKQSQISGALLWLLIATSFGFVVVQLDVTIVNVALPQIGAALHAGVAGLQWVVDAYTLSFAALLISAGVIGDRFGSRRIYLSGFLVFTVASVVCGVAPTIGILIAARALQGAGAALLVPTSLAILNHASENNPALRSRMVALWTAAGGVSIAAGPVAGGFLLAAFGWRSIFLVNIVLCGLAILLVLKFVPSDSRTGDSDAKASRQLDLSGQILAVLALTGIVGAIIEGGHRNLTHPIVVAGFLLGAVAAAIFIRVERRAASPMLPLQFFSLPGFSAAVVFGILVNLTYYGVIFVLSLYLQQARGYSALRTGIAFLPLTATFIVSNVITGWLTARTGSRIPMIFGALIAMAGYAFLLRLDETTSLLSMMSAFVLIPGGMGLAVPAMTTAILSSVPRERSGTASAVLNTARQTGGAIGVAVFGALLGHSRDKIIPGLHTSGLISTGLLLTAAALAWFGMQKRDV